MVQLVTGPTHTAGHILNVFITQSSTSVKVNIDPPMYSDHSLISSEIRMSEMRRWRWSTTLGPYPSVIGQESIWSFQARPVVIDAFHQSSQLRRSFYLLWWMSCYAPLETKVKRGRPSERWYTAECKEMKAETWRLERIDQSYCSGSYTMAPTIQHSASRLSVSLCEYWRTVIDSCPDTHTLWWRVGGLLHTVSTRVDELTADSFKVFFTGKVDAIRSKTESATSPSITVQEVPSLDLFQEVTSDEIYSMIRTAPNKHCALDPALTWLIKQLADVLATVITNMVNMSFNQGHFYKSQNHAIVGPRIKKSSLHTKVLQTGV